jgi:hypothetical protein
LNLRPLDIRRERTGLQLHHERVPHLLTQVVGEVSLLAAPHDLVQAGKPSLDVQQFLGCL